MLEKLKKLGKKPIFERLAGKTGKYTLFNFALLIFVNFLNLGLKTLVKTEDLR